MRLEEMAEPPLPADDWLRMRTVLCGICGSDSKQVFLRGERDNPLTAVVSFPQVLGHEAVGVVEEVGPAVRSCKAGDRIVINPWISCGPRGIDPQCASCQQGLYSLCERFTEGRFAPGIHAGNCADVPGAFAERIILHESQAIPIPPAVTWEAAVLADPFSVSLHAVLLAPPRPTAGPTIVYGCGTLGLLTIAVLRTLHPELAVQAIAKYRHQAELARRLGAEEVLMSDGDELVEALGKIAKATPLRPWSGRPWLIQGAGTIYDTVGSPESIEIGLRVAGPRGRIVVSGVEAPKRFEWTPLYFKEVSMIGSNAFGVEDFEGRRMHAMNAYFELLSRGLDVTPIITHRFPLERYRDAFEALHDKGRTGAVKAVFTFGTDEG
jgi:threonine dehydrogenase-like Zn-dependent dehydrogenase